MTYNDVFNHLAGKDVWGRDVIGLYPIRKDNTCSFLCTDFDDKSCEHGYKNDVLSFVNVCKLGMCLVTSNAHVLALELMCGYSLIRQ